MTSGTSESKYSGEGVQTFISDSKNPYPLIDVDCNLLHEDLTSLLQEETCFSNTDEHLRILKHPSTIAANIQSVFSPTSTIEESEKLHQILFDNKSDIGIRMSVGVHPYHAEEDLTPDLEQDTRNRVEKLMKDDEGYITCIGEAGLDYSEGFPERKFQLPWFKLQLQLSKKYNLPLFIHERLAFEDTIALIDEEFPDAENNDYPPIIIHCFTGTQEECKMYVERGYFLSVSGYILKNGKGPEEVQACLRNGIIPLDKLMIETDAPYMGFNGSRDSYYQVETAFNEDFQALNGKKRKRLLKGIYPNVPSSLPLVLEESVKLINEGRKERGEDEIEIGDAAELFYKTSANFFRFQD